MPSDARPMLRRRWNERDNCPGRCPWARRLWFVVALPIGLPVTWWRHCRHHSRGPDDPRPMRLGWQWSLAWLYWRTWFWAD